MNEPSKHEGKKCANFIPTPTSCAVGIEATGPMRWFLYLLEELGIECQVGDPARIRAAEPRKQKHDRRDAELILKATGGKTLSGNLDAFSGAQDLRSLLLHRHQWVRMRTRIQNALQAIALANGLRRGSRPVELRRSGDDCVIAITAPHLLSAERTTSDVPQDGRGNREPERTSRRAS